ncbi:nitroreductase family protein [Gordonia sp. CPCC 205515]|uniref:nitroreductase family protein n=1 Tax=Gordonia sp. CPCC 205515 TaxID=3140791 RepID=UPI003AF38466
MHELIANRWSARGYDPSATVSVDDLTEILDAGRWAPTWGRMQPVRFIVGMRGDETFAKLTTTLNRGNQSWAPASAALILLCTTDDPDDAKPHNYGAVDLGLALAQMILQAGALGYNAHPMAGFDPAAARAIFDIPGDKRPLAMLAVGRLADDRSTLPEEIRERDERARTRLPLAEVAFSETWGRPFATTDPT